MMASKHITCSKGLCRHGVVSDVGDAHMRGDTTMVPGEGSVKNDCMSRRQEGRSPASALSFIRSWEHDRDPGLS